MTLNYPNGKRVILSQNTTSTIPINYGKRGMHFERDINLTNQYYLRQHRAVIHKKPTPIQVVKVDYPKRSAAKIVEAYYRHASTTDYNGVYRGKYIDFEAKATNNKTAYNLDNIHQHQIEHMQAVTEQNGIAFLFLYFSSYNESYIIFFSDFLPFWERYLKQIKKSITYQECQKIGHLVKNGYAPRLDYLTIIDDIYFKE